MPGSSKIKFFRKQILRYLTRHASPEEDASSAATEEHASASAHSSSADITEEGTVNRILLSSEINEAEVLGDEGTQPEEHSAIQFIELINPGAPIPQPAPIIDVSTQETIGQVAQIAVPGGNTLPTSHGPTGAFRNRIDTPAFSITYSRTSDAASGDVPPPVVLFQFTPDSDRDGHPQTVRFNADGTVWARGAGPLGVPEDPQISTVWDNLNQAVILSGSSETAEGTSELISDSDQLSSSPIEAAGAEASICSPSSVADEASTLVTPNSNSQDSDSNSNFAANTVSTSASGASSAHPASSADTDSNLLSSPTGSSNTSPAAQTCSATPSTSTSSSPHPLLSAATATSAPDSHTGPPRSSTSHQTPTHRARPLSETAYLPAFYGTSPTSQARMNWRYEYGRYAGQTRVPRWVDQEDGPDVREDEHRGRVRGLWVHTWSPYGHASLPPPAPVPVPVPTPAPVHTPPTPTATAASTDTSSVSSSSSSSSSRSSRKRARSPSSDAASEESSKLARLSRSSEEEEEEEEEVKPPAPAKLKGKGKSKPDQSRKQTREPDARDSRRFAARARMVGTGTVVESEAGPSGCSAGSSPVQVSVCGSSSPTLRRSARIATSSSPPAVSSPSPRKRSRDVDDEDRKVKDTPTKRKKRQE